jgi:hypothetical protein
MAKRKARKRTWLGKALLGTALGLSYQGSTLWAQSVPAPVAVAHPAASLPENTSPPAGAPSGAGLLGSDPMAPNWLAPINGGAAPCCDPIAPAWCDPISRVPDFFGGFMGGGIRASRNTLTTQTTTTSRPLTFTGSGAEGGGFRNLVPPYVGPTGPGGPYSLTAPIPILDLNFPTFRLGQNPEFTPQVTAKFPGATFVSGGGTFRDAEIADFFYNYLFTTTHTTTTGQNISVNLPNPAGGGLVGRNDYFDNGSAVPQDRVYFFYNHVESFQGLERGFDVNRYVFGFEKTFLDQRFSVECRVPFAGTADSDQGGGDGMAVNQTEFGNVGLAVKGVVYRTPNFLVSLGLGFSLPTASDSRLFVGDVPVIVVQNRTCLLQPLLGVAWAPNDRFYSQAGVQFDFDPSGNPVQVLSPNGTLSRVGVLNDQTYAQVNAAAGYWAYQNKTAFLSGIALQGELHYDSSFGRRDTVQDGINSISDLSSGINALTGSTGAIVRFGERSNLSIGVSFPLAGDRLYDWNVIAQVNFRFGGP